MTVWVDVEWETSEAVHLLKGMSRRTYSFRPVFVKIRQELSAAWSVNALTGGSLSGGWPPEKPGTWSAESGFPRLHRTGALESSFINLRGKPNDIQPHRAVFGTNIKYAKFHQYGTEDMPSREIIFQPPMFVQRFASDVADYLSDETWFRRAMP